MPESGHLRNLALHSIMASMATSFARRSALPALVILLLAACAVGEVTMPASSAIQQIRYGVFSGECLGYCNTEITVTDRTAGLLKTSNIPGGRMPDITAQRQVTAGQWNRLTSAVDVFDFMGLPRTIGMPDAADQGGEWVEITAGGRTHRVTLELGGSVPGLEMLLAQLRSLREAMDTR